MNSGHVVEQGEGGASKSKRYPRDLDAAELESLGRRTYLDTDQACHYLCFQTLDGLYAWLRRHAIPRLKRGRILIMRRRDLDLALTKEIGRVETFTEETNQGATPEHPPVRRRRRSS